MGILLRRRHPTAERITPSQGDEGLDIIMREPDGWTVHQVKKYATQPNASQRSKIKKSLDALIGRSDATTVIKAWQLVMPVNPTPPSLRWFTELTASAPFPCTWSGSDFIDGLAAEFPDVIDYYFRDGKDRLASAIADLAKAMQPPTATGLQGADSEVQSDVAVPPILAMHNLINRLDPHFRYDFSVDTEPPDLTRSSGFVFAETRGSGRQYFTFRVYEKYRGALADRPITLNAMFRTPEQADRDAMRDFIDYGAPLELGQDLATIDADLPGGLAGSTTGAVRILPLSSTTGSQPRPLRMRVIDVADDSEHEIVILMQPATAGLDGRNLRGVAEHEGGAFSVELRFTNEDGSQNFQFKPNELSGKIAGRVAPGLRFLSKLRAGNKFQLAPEFGPYTGEPFTISRDLTALVDNRVLELVESVAALQSLTQEQLILPDLSQLTVHQGEEIVVAAKVLSGGEVPVFFSELQFTSNGSAVPEGETAMFMTRYLDVTIGDVALSVGPVGFHFERVQLSLEEAETSTGTITVRPVDTPKIKAVARMLPAASE